MTTTTTTTDHAAAIAALDGRLGHPTATSIDAWTEARAAQRVAYLANVAGLDPDDLPDHLAADLARLAELEDSDGLARVARLLDAAYGGRTPTEVRR